MRKKTVKISIYIVILISAIVIVGICFHDSKLGETIGASGVELVQNDGNDNVFPKEANVTSEGITSGVSGVDSDNLDESLESLEISSNKSSGIQNGPAASDSVESENQILHFVDAFGEEYETEILPDVPKHDYDLNKFIHDGSKLSYDDEKYTYRLGIDVSYHQGNIDFSKVKAAGYDFVILRIGYRGYGKAGNIMADRKFPEYYSKAKAAGLDVGVYFFAQAINETEAEEEADFVINTLKGYDLDLPVVYDPESILDDVARTDNVSGEQFTKNTLCFCQKISDAGFDPMVYSNMLWEAFEFDMTKISNYPIWYADYEALPQTPYQFTYWQYSNEGKVDGVSGAVDVDIELIIKKEN